MKNPPWEHNCNARLPLAQGGLLYYATQKRRSVEFVSHEMGLQIPHRVHAEIPKEGDLGQLRADIGKYIRRCCMYKGVDIIDAHAMPDHIHMLIRIPPKLSVSSFMGYLKGKMSLMIFDEQANLKYNYGARLRIVEA